MLPASARLTRRKEFSAVVRRGHRVGRDLLVVHALSGQAGPTRVGFVVGKAVGDSVVRHRVIRRLRHLMRARLAVVPAGTWLVVRALPPASGADSARLAAELDRALQRMHPERVAR
jgi:ribonuclease P protein component